MLSSAGGARPPWAWIVVAHVLGGAAIGALDAARLHAVGVALAVVPVFAATGLLAAVLIGATERVATGRAWWVAAAIRALPALVVLVPVGATLFDGAFAQTLPLAKQAPILVPLAGWLGTAIAIAIGRRVLRDGDRMARSIAIMAVAGLIGALVWVERHVLRTGYANAHAGITLALIVLAGIAIRVARPGNAPRLLAALLAGIVIGTAVAASAYGLTAATDRRVLAEAGDQARDLVRVWRGLVDLDRDGSSAILGGGDCNDFDASIHPGAVDVPGDGIDQDCDGSDATVAAKSPPPAAVMASTVDPWRKTVQPVLDRTRKMNILIITVDALRFDLLAPDAPNRDDFPNLTKLLADSVWFTHAIAPASGTDVSLSTVLTGRFDPYQPVATTLLEALRASGRRTYAAIPGEVTRYVGDTLIGRGVDRFVTVQTDWEKADIGDHVSAPSTSIEGVRALNDAGTRPWAIWLHYFDVHEHHQIDVPKQLLAQVHDGGSPVIHKYRALLHAIDGEVGRIEGELAKRGLADSTIILFASDHGEALGVDPRLLDTHGQVAYHTLVRVPLALHIPGVAPGQRTDLVSLVDLAPTLLDLLGTPDAMQPLDGTDLVPAILDAPAELRPQQRAIAIHEELQWSVVEWPYQLLVRPADDIVELYDLDHDPLEHSDLSASHADIVTRLRARYAESPVVKVDRTPNGRTFREQQAQPLQHHAPK
ncbi:MAG: sulfatase-like hydrolase/transferase [Deltaproteobacteria bacterium]